MSTITTKGQKAKAVNARDFDIRDMIGYALGDVGNNFTFNLVNSFLMIFYTNVFGLAAALVGHCLWLPVSLTPSSTSWSAALSTTRR